MKRVLSLFLLLVTIFIVTACGGTTDPPEDPTPIPITLANPSEQTADVVLDVRGEATIIAAERTAAIFCDVGSPSTIRLTIIGGGDQMYLSIPADATDTIEIIGTDDDSTASATVNYRNNVTNYAMGTGELDISAMPVEAGDLFIATLNVDLTADTGNSITIGATFNVDTTEDTFADCNA